MLLLVASVTVGILVVMCLTVITCCWLGWGTTARQQTLVEEGKQAFPHLNYTLPPVKRRPGLDQEHDLVLVRTVELGGLPHPDLLEPLPSRKVLYNAPHTF